MVTYSRVQARRLWAEQRQRVEDRRPALLDLLAGDEAERARLDQLTTAELICLSHCPATLPGT